MCYKEEPTWTIDKEPLAGRIAEWIVLNGPFILLAEILIAALFLYYRYIYKQ